MVFGAHPASSPLGTGVLSSGVKQPGREADHLIPSSAEVKTAWSFTSTSTYIYVTSYLIKQQG
jgi:hypothetical protein